MTPLSSEQSTILAFLQHMLPHWPEAVLKMIAVNEISARAAREVAEISNAATKREEQS